MLQKYLERKRFKSLNIYIYGTDCLFIHNYEV